MIKKKVLKVGHSVDIENADQKDVKHPHYVDKHVGDQLRKKRREKGISQDELAKAADLTFQQIQKYEKGLNRISCSKLHEFASFLKTDIRYFFQGLEAREKSPEELDYVGNINNDAEIGEIVKLLRSIQDYKIRYSILNLLKAIVWQ